MSKRPVKVLMVLGVVLSAAVLAGCAKTSSKATTTTTTTKAPTKTTVTTQASSTPKGTAVPSGFSPLSFTAISATHFWLLGISGPKGAKVATLVRSTNGGKNFVALPTPSIPLGSASVGRLVDNTVRFADPKDGYIYGMTYTSNGKTLYVTHNGGASWSEQSLPGLLAFGVGGGFVYAVTASCTTGHCTDVTLRHSPVNQDAWSQSALSVSSVTPLASLTVHGNSMWVTLNPSSGTAQNQTIEYSSNDGATLSSEKSPCYSGLGGTLAASSSAVVWALCPTGMESSAFRSNNAGASWSPVNYHPMANSALIAPASDTVAVLAPGGGTLVRVTNAGQTSAVVYTPPSGTTPYWTYVGFTTTTVGIGLAEVPSPTGTTTTSYETLYRTTNAGLTWSAIPINS